MAHFLKFHCAMIERRCYNRLPVTLPITFKPSEHNNGVQGKGGLTKDISQGGAFFLYRTSLCPDIAADQVFYLTIKFLIQNEDYRGIPFIETLQTRGRVIRTETSQERPHICGVAVKFLDHLKYIFPAHL